MVLFLFHALVAAHIVTGSIGAIAFWVPVIGRKGGANHARWGKIFTFAALSIGRHFASPSRVSFPGTNHRLVVISIHLRMPNKK